MADAFSSPHLYTRVPTHGVMEWEIRKERILGEIARFSPDIITLQVKGEEGSPTPPTHPPTQP